MKTLPDKCIDLVLTDPPYKLSQTYSANVDADNLLAVSSIIPVAQEMFRTLKSGGYAVIYYDMRILPLLIQAMRLANFQYLRGLTFYRRWGNAHKLSGWMSTSDFILIFRKPAEFSPKFYSNDWRHDVYLKDKPEKMSANHPAQKPVEDLKHLIKHLCPSDGIVVDPYLGSGSTAIAATELGINYIGCEISPEYCKIAEERIKSISNTLF